MKKALTALSLLLACLSADAAQKPKAKDAAVEARVHRVEHGLLPNTLIKGAPPATMELAERMRFYEVPGVSVAVIEDGRVEWARGYGVKEAGKSDPVTPETMFPDSELTREQKVTLRRLLSHSAGLTVHGFPGYAGSHKGRHPPSPGIEIPGEGGGG